jgi:hypothetical protein
MSKQLSLAEMEPSARAAMMGVLRGKEVPPEQTAPGTGSDAQYDVLLLGSGYEGEYGVFALFVPGKAPRIVARARVHRQSGEVTAEAVG